jgi:hypothetical protein
MNLQHLVYLFNLAGGWLTFDFLKDHGYEPSVLRAAGLIRIIDRWRNSEMCYEPTEQLLNVRLTSVNAVTPVT